MKNQIAKQINTTLIVINVILFIYMLFAFIFKDKLGIFLYIANIALFGILMIIAYFLLGYM